MMRIEMLFTNNARVVEKGGHEDKNIGKFTLC
jgi:hypothetical protein